MVRRKNKKIEFILLLFLSFLNRTFDTFILFFHISSFSRELIAHLIGRGSSREEYWEDPSILETKKEEEEEIHNEDEGEMNENDGEETNECAFVLFF